MFLCDVFGYERIIKDPAGLAWFISHSQELTKIMAREIDIAPRTMRHIIKLDLGLLNDKQDNALPLH